MNEFNGPMVTIPRLERQGWLVSVILHGVIVTTVVFGLGLNLVIEATEPVRFDLIVVERDEPVPAAAETVVSGSTSQKPLNRERLDRSSPPPIVHTREASRPRPLPQARDTVEPIRPIVRQILESQLVNREVEQQPDASSSEPGDWIRTERDLAAVQELRHEQPEVVVSDVTTPIVSQVITQQVTELETTSRNTEMRSRSVQGAANSILDSDVNPDGSQRQKHVVQTVPGTVESPSQAPATGGADSTSAPGVNTDGESRKHEARAVPGTVEVPSHAPEVSPPTQMGTSIVPGGEKEGSVRNMASASPSGKGAGPDYGWLKRLLWERINRIKHYSDEAFDKEWEGRVVMVVTVRADGRIDDVNVAESSGNRSLDREAANLIARVSPIELDRALGAARVKLRVPISFGLE